MNTKVRGAGVVAIHCSLDLCVPSDGNVPDVFAGEPSRPVGRSGDDQFFLVLRKERVVAENHFVCLLKFSFSMIPSHADGSIFVIYLPAFMDLFWGPGAAFRSRHNAGGSSTARVTLAFRHG